jgi:DNA-directed RNA polymerase sigma subunit (sigma70/sigma32)
MNTLRERDREALALRKSGKTYREIAEGYGVTVERARQIVFRAYRLTVPFGERDYDSLNPQKIVR